MMNPRSLLVFGAVFAMQISALAGGQARITLADANDVVCSSRGLGNFALLNLNSDKATQSRAVFTDIDVVRRGPNFLTYQYSEYKRTRKYVYTLVLKSAYMKEDAGEGDRPRLVYSGHLQNGDIESPVECVIR